MLIGVYIGSLELMAESIMHLLGANNHFVKIPVFVFYSKHMLHFMSASSIRFTSKRPVVHLVMKKVNSENLSMLCTWTQCLSRLFH